MQLAPLALPPHPLVLARIENAPPMQQQEAIASGTRSVPAVQLPDRLRGDGEKLGIARKGLLVGIDPVRQQGEGEVAAGAGQMVNLEPLNLLQNICVIRQQRRHGNERSKRLRNASRQIKAGQHHRAKTPGD